MSSIRTDVPWDETNEMYPGMKPMRCRC